MGGNAASGGVGAGGSAMGGTATGGVAGEGVGGSGTAGTATGGAASPPGGGGARSNASGGSAGGGGTPAMLSGDCVGDFQLRTYADVEALRECTRISGALTSHGAQWTDSTTTPAPLELPKLVSLGSLAIEMVNQEYWNEISFPALETAEGGISIRNAPSVERIGLPKLRDAGDGIGLSYTGAAELTLPELTVARAIRLDTTYDLLSVSCPKLMTTSSLYLSDVRGITQLDFAALTTVEGPVTIDDARRLATLSLPSLTTVGALSIANNDLLASLELPALSSVTGSLYVTDNAALPTCQAEALRAQAAPQLAEVMISGNDDSAVCP